MRICNVVSQYQTPIAVTDFHKFSFNLYRCNGDTFHYTRLLQAPSSLALNTPRDGAAIAPLSTSPPSQGRSSA